MMAPFQIVITPPIVVIALPILAIVPLINPLVWWLVTLIIHLVINIGIMCIHCHILRPVTLVIIINTVSSLLYFFAVIVMMTHLSRRQIHQEQGEVWKNGVMTKHYMTWKTFGIWSSWMELRISGMTGVITKGWIGTNMSGSYYMRVSLKMNIECNCHFTGSSCTFGSHFTKNWVKLLQCQTNVGRACVSKWIAYSWWRETKGPETYHGDVPRCILQGIHFFFGCSEFSPSIGY